MELGTFGSILKFALEQENEAIQFYKSASAHLSNQRLNELFSELVIRGEKRIKTLERVRRENTTEMILEPIVDFDSEKYSIGKAISDSGDENFYITAAKKIEFLSEAAYAFELLAEKNAETKKRLSS